MREVEFLAEMKREEESGKDYRKSMFCGFISAAVLIASLLASAILSEKYTLLFIRREVTAKACLTLSSILCAILVAAFVKRKRLLCSLAGESVILMIFLLIGLLVGFRGGLLSVIFDAGIMLIGAFAGSLIPIKAQKQRRGKR